MNKNIAFSIGSFLCSFAAIAQTNVASKSCAPFCLPSVELWTVVSNSVHNTQAEPSGPTPISASEQFSINRNGKSSDLWARLEQSGEFYLTQPEAPSPSHFVRAVDAVFAPEAVHLGKTSLNCSVVTAIKRRNPLCLLNPIFFQLSW